MFDDEDQEMWKHSEVMRIFAENYIDKLHKAPVGVEIYESVEDPVIVEDIPMTSANQYMVIDIKARATELIANLNKIAAESIKYNNERVSYAIEQSIAELKFLAELDQE